MDFFLKKYSTPVMLDEYVENNLSFAWNFGSHLYDQLNPKWSTTEMFMVMLFYAGGTSPVKGDILVIAGATLYAISNVSEVKHWSQLHRKHIILRYYF